MMRKFITLGVLLIAVVALTVSVQWNLPNARASSHREAPLISQDPAADATDLYAFVSPDAPNTVTFIAAYYPFEDPNGGPNFYRFGDDVLYRIYVDNNGDAKPDIWWDWEFHTTVKNGSTFLYNTAAIDSLTSSNWNVVQTYNFFRGTPTGRTMVASGLTTTPSNIGPKSTPNFDALVAEAVHPIGTGGAKVFAGQADDPFFLDLGAIFDLLNLGRPGVDDLSGMNVQVLAFQVPITSVTRNGQMPTGVGDTNGIIGVWTTAYRRGTRVLSSKGTSTGSGNWVQVSRLDNPLVNEVVVPLAAKDLWNGSLPENDAQFLGGVTDPEVPKLLKLLFGVNVPPSPRNDLVTIFLTGIGKVPGLLPDGLNQPANVKPASLLRLNLAVPSKGCNQGANRMGLLALDVAGFPNGRRLCDDVIDIAIQAMAGATPFTPDFNVSPNNALGDGVNCNPIRFMDSFPYVARAENGFSHPHHNINPSCP